MSLSESTMIAAAMTQPSLGAQLRTLGLLPAQIATLLTRIPARYTEATDPQAVLQYFLHDPYRVATPIGEFGFEQADTFALKHGLPAYAVHRLQALAEHIVADWQQETGACSLTRAQFFNCFARLDARVSFETMATALQTHPRLQCNDGLITTRSARQQIDMVRQLLQKLAREGMALSVPADLSHELDAAEAALACAGYLNLQQRNALSRLLSSPQRLHCWQASPASGKKTLLAFISYLLRQRRHIAFASACREGSSALHDHLKAFGHSATSLHDLLDPVIVGEECRYRHHATRPLAADLIIVDACHALSVTMLSHLLPALSDEAHLLLIGDPDRLPVHDGDGCFIELCTMVGDQQRLDCSYHTSPAIQASFMSLRSQHFDWSYYPTVCHRYFSPQREGDDAVLIAWQQARAQQACADELALVICAGTPATSRTALNHYNLLLQNLRNPRHSGNTLHETKLRKGDPLMACLDVIVAVGTQSRLLRRGERALLAGQDAHSGDLLLRLADGAEARLGAGDMDVLRLAYAISVRDLSVSSVQTLIAVFTSDEYPDGDSRLLYSLFASTRQHITLFARRKTLDELAARTAVAISAGLLSVKAVADA